jgi:hypothetical protein
VTSHLPAVIDKPTTIPSRARIPPTSARTSTPRKTSRNYERLRRVLEHTLSLHGVTDANGRQGVDEKKVREAFVAARISENETNNKNVHKAMWNGTMKRLLADGVAERDGSILRILNLP